MYIFCLAQSITFETSTTVQCWILDPLPPCHGDVLDLEARDKILSLNLVDYLSNELRCMMEFLTPNFIGHSIRLACRLIFWLLEKTYLKIEM